MNEHTSRRCLRRALAGLMLLLSIAGPRPALALDIGDPSLAYFFRELALDNPLDPLSGAQWRLAESGAQLGGELFARREMGGSMLGGPAGAGASAYNEGKTFLAEAVAPRTSSTGLAGAWSEVYVAQSFLKLNASSTLSFTFSAAKLELLSFGDLKGDGWLLTTSIGYEVWAFDHATGEEFWRESQSRILRLDYGATSAGSDNTFVVDRRYEFSAAEGLVGNPAWGPWAGTGGTSSPGQGKPGEVLNGDFTGYVDLSNLRQFDEFTVAFKLWALATDRRQGETGALAYIKDPVSSDDGGAMTLGGLDLQATNNVLPGTLPVPEPATWALWGLGLALLGGMARRRTGDGAQGSRVRQSAPRWMR